WFGAPTPFAVILRIIAVTSRDLAAAIKAGLFREDLYHRLGVIALTLPPLRERKEDMPLLAAYFPQRVASETKKHFSGITAEAREKLIAYAWPGNIRELANV